MASAPEKASSLLLREAREQALLVIFEGRPPRPRNGRSDRLL
jgi:hypothetical protein